MSETEPSTSGERERMANLRDAGTLEIALPGASKAGDFGISTLILDGGRWRRLDAVAAADAGVRIWLDGRAVQTAESLAPADPLVSHRPPKIGDTYTPRDGRERRVNMVLSLMPADARPDVLEQLHEMAVVAGAADPNAERNRADGWAVGLHVAFVLDPRDVRAFIEGRRSDLKTWMDVELIEPAPAADAT